MPTPNLTHVAAVAISILVSISVSPAQAIPSDLAKISEAEKSWRQTEIRSGQFNEPVSAVITDSGKIRIRELPTYLLAPATIGFHFYPKTNSTNLNSYCNAIRNIVSQSKERQEKWLLKIQLNPLAANLSLKVENQEVSTGAIENPITFKNVIPQLSLQPDSYSKSETRIDVDEFQKLIRDQLLSQQKSIMASGVATLDLTGWDDVACDLFQSRGELALLITYQFESAVVLRKSLIGENEMKGIYEVIHPRWKSQNDTVRNLILGGAALGGAVVQVMNKSALDLGIEKFFNIYGAFFDLTKRSELRPKPQSFKAAKEQLDELSRPVIQNTSVVQLRISIPEASSNED